MVSCGRAFVGLETEDCLHKVKLLRPQNIPKALVDMYVRLYQGLPRMVTAPPQACCC